MVFSVFVLTINLLDKLNFENGAITIIDVCETIGAALVQLFVNVCIIIVISWSHIKEPLEVLGVDLVLLKNINVFVEVMAS